MRLENIKLTPEAFGVTPMAFVKPEVRDVLSEAMSIYLLENAGSRTRENWQQKQLANLFAFARERSRFWAQRLPAIGNAKNISLDKLSVLHRSDVRQQVESEGALFKSADFVPVKKGYTSGSSGIPLIFYRTAMNRSYEAAQGLYQALLTDLDFRQNRTQMRSSSAVIEHGFSVSTEKSWMGPLAAFARSGKSKTITYCHPDMTRLKKEFLKEEVGYLIANPWFVEILLQAADPSFLRKVGLKQWTPIGGAPSDYVRTVFGEQSIPIRAHYSSREIGLMATECATHPGFYHVANSNVIIEIDPRDQFKMGRDSVGSILVTHLHSYATPFIRYANGDVATLNKSCPCGHEGPTLSNLYGRQKNLIKKADGSLATFFIQVKDNRWLTKFDEYRFRQTAINLIEIDVACKDPLTQDDVGKFQKIVRSLAGSEFEVKVNSHAKIDWGADTKRLGFRNEII